MFSVSRRDLVLGAAGACVAFGINKPVALIGAACAQETTTRPFRKYKVGDIEVFSLLDGMRDVPLREGMIKNVTVEQIKAALRAAGLPDTHSPLTFTAFWQDPVANLSQLIWPALVVGFRSAGLSARMMRSALLEVLGDDYIRTARAKGLSERAVVRRHAVRNALLPVITVVGLESAVILGGLVVTEQVFNLNGLGKLLLEGVTRRDYTLTQALVMLSASAFVAMNLLVDLCYAWLDPRIRYR